MKSAGHRPEIEVNNTIALKPLSEDWEMDLAGGLHLRATTHFDSETFRQFYDGYDQAFVLPDEKESASGFEAALELNHGVAYAALANEYGPFREICFTFHDQQRFVGGANLFATAFRPNSSEAIASSNLNYIYVDRYMRGQGYFASMVSGLRALVPDLFQFSGSSSKVLMFVEQNDPFRLSEAQYDLDTQTSGVDQFDRIAIWAKAGARLVDHPYVQPRLSADQSPDQTLALSLIGEAGSRLSACVLLEHLRRFFAISVLKGSDPMEDLDIGAQLSQLERLCTQGSALNLYDPLPMLMRARSPGERSKLWGDTRPASLVEALTRE
jgi:hypothetical protein